MGKSRRPCPSGIGYHDRYLPGGALHTAVDALIERKRAGSESEGTARLAPLDALPKFVAAAVQYEVLMGSAA